jgi:hypothetical protein
MREFVENCSACGKDHYIEFKEVDEGMMDGWSHYGICENMDDMMVFMREVEAVQINLTDE